MCRCVLSGAAQQQWCSSGTAALRGSDDGQQHGWQQLVYVTARLSHTQAAETAYQLGSSGSVACELGVVCVYGGLCVYVWGCVCAASVGIHVLMLMLLAVTTAAVLAGLAKPLAPLWGVWRVW